MGDEFDYSKLEEYKQKIVANVPSGGVFYDPFTGQKSMLKTIVENLGGSQVSSNIIVPYRGRKKAIRTPELDEMINKTVVSLDTKIKRNQLKSKDARKTLKRIDGKDKRKNYFIPNGFNYTETYLSRLANANTLDGQAAADIKKIKNDLSIAREERSKAKAYKKFLKSGVFRFSEWKGNDITFAKSPTLQKKFRNAKKIPKAVTPPTFAEWEKAGSPSIAPQYRGTSSRRATTPRRSRSRSRDRSNNMGVAQRVESSDSETEDV
jgi:hypothetical protein